MAANNPATYLTVGTVRAINREILQRAGGQPAFLRDPGLLESALQRPQDAAYYEGADLVSQAALYMVGIALNHPFVDGNKRTGYIAGMTFLRLNGALQPSPALDDPALGAWLEDVVTHRLSFEEFVSRLRQRIKNP